MHNTVFPPPTIPLIAVQESSSMFPVHRIYCVGRNYSEHAKEMGFSEAEPPFFFMKPADAIVTTKNEGFTDLPYPSLTEDLQYEVELVIAIGKAGSNIPKSSALSHVFGYAVGLDMTRRDLQRQLRQNGRPWCLSKGFDASAPISPIVPLTKAGHIDKADISLTVNGQIRQHSCTDKMIWNINEIVSAASQGWLLQAGDLIFTGTPEGVGSVQRGDKLIGNITGLPSLHVQIT